MFRPLVDNLRYDDPFLVLADYASYVDCQERVSAAWQDADAWTRMSILNTARSGKFSSDRAIAEYCDDIWNVWPVTVKIYVTRPSESYSALTDLACDIHGDVADRDAGVFCDMFARRQLHCGPAAGPAAPPSSAIRIIHPSASRLISMSKHWPTVGQLTS